MRSSDQLGKYFVCHRFESPVDAATQSFLKESSISEAIKAWAKCDSFNKPLEMAIYRANRASSWNGNQNQNQNRNWNWNWNWNRNRNWSNKFHSLRFCRSVSQLARDLGFIISIARPSFLIELQSCERKRCPSRFICLSISGDGTRVVAWFCDPDPDENPDESLNPKSRLGNQN